MEHGSQHPAYKIQTAYTRADLSQAPIYFFFLIREGFHVPCPPAVRNSLLINGLSLEDAPYFILHHAPCSLLSKACSLSPASSSRLSVLCSPLHALCSLVPAVCSLSLAQKSSAPASKILCKILCSLSPACSTQSSSVTMGGWQRLQSRARTYY